MSDEGKARILSKLVEEDKARVAVEEDKPLEEESVEVLAEVWTLEKDEVPLVPHLKKFFSPSAWLIVEEELNALKQQSKKGIYGRGWGRKYMLEWTKIQIVMK